MSKETLKLLLKALGYVLTPHGGTRAHVWDSDEARFVVQAYKVLEEALKQEPDYSICPSCGGMASDPIVPLELRHLKQEHGEPVAKAWAEGYRMGIADERTSEANIGIAGFNAKVEPDRQNPYGIPQPKQEQGEPVAWQWLNTAHFRKKLPKDAEKGAWNPVYTTPQQRKPLRDEMLKQMRESCESNNMEMRGAFIDGWTSAEAAHGIKE